ncbi:DNA repair protein RadC [Halomonas campisalis]|uniref:DNA repair protein RadC n=1 Tax=Billgrantia campisalis TaxID=74661 RepID=A0ABS9P9U2_9GAMM|nr:DNA repair protein RadC [Halomonas campisalis]MCG6658525.1 DNA repair protein RadC [Halomonas campisalis]MDR5863386.1 DNA repair protein RadC [Halomonas campisalis]
MHHRKLSAGEVAGTYHVTAPVTEAELLSIAQAFARRRLARGRKITQPALAFEYLQILLQDYEHEVFSAIFLDTQHRVIKFEELFRGTIDAANVYPREVVKRALAQNAAAVILVHNHPSGDPEPSDADRRITQRLKEALGLVEVRVIDHVVVGGDGYQSFAEAGFL